MNIFSLLKKSYFLKYLYVNKMYKNVKVFNLKKSNNYKTIYLYDILNFIK